MTNKNTKTVYYFYSSKMADPKLLKNKNVCLIAIGNAKYETECKKYAKMYLSLRDANNDDPFNGIDFKDINSLKERIENWLRKNNMKKFDIVIMNPPYDGTGHPLYLQILECVKQYAAATVCVCPAQWVKNYRDTEYIAKIKKETCNDLISHTAVGNPFNDACLGNDIMVFHFGKASNYENYDDIRLERFANPDLAKSIWRKLEKRPSIADFDRMDKQKPKYVHSSYIRGNQTKYVHSSYIRGHQLISGFGAKPAWDWTTLFGDEQRTTFYDVPPAKGNWNYWNFETEEECENFVAATETDVSMFALFIGKQNQSNPVVAISLMPWMGDYTHPWTNEEIAAELGLTQEEIGYISAEMKDFGWKCKK